MSTKLWTLRVAGGVELSEHGPYQTEKERDDGMSDFMHELEIDYDTVIRLDIDDQGRPSAVVVDDQTLRGLKYPIEEIVSLEEMKINERGQCPVCRRKPIPYKRDRKLFCTKCCREFSLVTGEWMSNNHWIAPMVEKPHTMDCLCGECPHVVGQIVVGDFHKPHLVFRDVSGELETTRAELLRLLIAVNCKPVPVAYHPRVGDVVHFTDSPRTTTWPK